MKISDAWFFARSSIVRCGNSEENVDTVYIAMYIFIFSLHCYGPLKALNLKSNNCGFKNFLPSILHWISQADVFGNYCVKLSSAKIRQACESKLFRSKNYMSGNLSLSSSSTMVYPDVLCVSMRKPGLEAEGFQGNGREIWELLVMVGKALIFERDWSAKDSNYTMWRPSVPEDWI